MQFGQHGVKHRSSDFIAVTGVIQSEGDGVGSVIDQDSGGI